MADYSDRIAWLRYHVWLDDPSVFDRIADALEAQAKEIEQKSARIAELEVRERQLEEMFLNWHDEARKAYTRIAELEVALKDLREAARGVDQDEMHYSQRDEWGHCLIKADEVLKGEKG